MADPPLIRVRVLTPEEFARLYNEGNLDAWELQFEYMIWRHSQGLEPSPDRLNRWEQAWDLLGEHPSAHQTP